MSLDLKSVHVRLSHEAHAALSTLADLYDADNAEMCRRLLEECLLGRLHGVKVAVANLQRAGMLGTASSNSGSGRDA